MISLSPVCVLILWEVLHSLRLSLSNFAFLMLLCLCVSLPRPTRAAKRQENPALWVSHLVPRCAECLITQLIRVGALLIKRLPPSVQTLYEAGKDDIVTAASCTTNCLAPVVKVVLEKLGIVHGCITTSHCLTNTQSLLDAPNSKKSDLRRARSALVNLAPTSTGSATAIALIFPELKGKLNGLAIRVPLTNASITDCVFEVKRPTTVEELNALFKVRGFIQYFTLQPLIGRSLWLEPQGNSKRDLLAVASCVALPLQ